MRTGGLVAVVTAVLTSMLPVTVSPADASPRAAASSSDHADVRGSSGVGRGRLLDRPEHGRRAVTRLAERLDVAASRNRMSSAALSRLLTQDASAWVDRHGLVYFVDPPSKSPAGAAGAAAAPPAPLPLADTFALHSKPWATRKVFLDFDGATVAGTTWNLPDPDSELPGLPEDTYAGFSLDSDPSFNAVEHDVVQDVWARVAEDYAPFEVDVTTEDPTESGLRRSDSADPSYGVAVLVSGSDAARSGTCGDCAGIAYLNAFDAITEAPAPLALQPAWVFPGSVGNRSADIAAVASHELGHTLGLEHDGVDDESYYTGSADGLWSPIMGRGYAPLNQFSNGDYPGATNQEDDLAVLAAHGGRPVSDDHGDFPATATTLALLPPDDPTGVIGTRTDRDVFAIGPCSGDLQVDAVPEGVAPNLDLGLRLLGGTGVELTTAAPPTVPIGTSSDRAASGLDAHLSVTGLTTGTYYVEVDGVGQAGYSDYGSLGAYELIVSGCPTAPATRTPDRPLHLDVSVVPHAGAVDLTWQPPGHDGGAPVESYDILLDGTPVAEGVPATAHTFRFWELEGLTDYTLGVRAANTQGKGALAVTHVRTPVLPPSEPLGVVVTTAGLGPGLARVTWTAPTSVNGNVGLSYQVRREGLGADGHPDRVFPAGTALTVVVGGLVDGTAYTFEVWATGDELEGRRSVPVSFAYKAPPSPPMVAKAPGPPRIGKAASGARRGPVTATARWAAPTSTGGATITAYRLTALRLGTTGKVVRRTTVAVGGSVRARTMRLARGRYRFAVVAVNRAGTSRSSARSNLVTAR
jgi:hypothetical protein